jgi:hypothetical protein
MSQAGPLHSREAGDVSGRTTSFTHGPETGVVISKCNTSIPRSWNWNWNCGLGSVPIPGDWAILFRQLPKRFAVSEINSAHHSCRWDLGFEPHSGHGCLRAFLLCVGRDLTKGLIARPRISVGCLSRSVDPDQF